VSVVKKLQWQRKAIKAVSGPFVREIQERDRQMENKPAQNIQDSFLNTARKDKSQITIYLLSGVKLTGRIRSFDKYSVVLETNNQEQLIFKHAISTVVMAKGSHHGDSRQHAPAAAEGESSTVKSEG
jgi:host factor-I protein